MKRHGRNGGTGVHETPSLATRTAGDPAARIRGVAYAVELALGEIDAVSLEMALHLRSDKRPDADPTPATLDLTYALASLAFPDGGWREAARVGSSVASRRARTHGFTAAAAQAAAMAAGEELALAFLLHDRLPTGVYLSLVHPWLAAFPQAAAVDGVGENPFTQEEIEMATATNRARTSRPTTKPAAKPSPPAPKPAAAPVARTQSGRRFWIQEKAGTGEQYLAYFEQDTKKVRRPGKLHPPGAVGRLAVEAEAKAKGWQIVADATAAGKPASGPSPVEPVQETQTRPANKDLIARDRKGLLSDPARLPAQGRKRTRASVAADLQGTGGAALVDDQRPLQGPPAPVKPAEPTPVASRATIVKVMSNDADVDTRSPYTPAEWNAIKVALRAERVRRNGKPFSQDDQMDTVREVVRNLRQPVEPDQRPGIERAVESLTDDGAPAA
jgi:hypothetical protein